MKRRSFISAAGVSTAGLATGVHLKAMGNDHSAGKGFSLYYAPHFGMFGESAGNDLVDQLKYAADKGFRAWEDNDMRLRPVSVQETIARAMTELGMRMGVFVAHKIYWDQPNLASGNKDWREEFLEDIRKSVDVALRTHAKWMTVVPGTVDQSLEMGYQTANVIESLRLASEILEPHDLVMVLEPLNWWANHAGQFLTKTAQAFEICRAVDSPACKILFDVYHQQIQEGNIIPNIDMAWDEIAYFQVGDNPGRNEPTTGEINFANVFRHLRSKGYDGIVGMEHGKSIEGKPGEDRVIEAYVEVDAP